MNLLYVGITAIVACASFAQQQQPQTFGLCLHEVHVPHGADIQCIPPNTLPQVCSFKCSTGYYTPPHFSTSTTEFSCYNAICTNQCTATNATCSGTIPVSRIDGAGITYTDYITEERPCCTLHKPEVSVCNLGPCTGSCGDPGVYTFDALTCPEVCIPYRDVETPVFPCEPCALPALQQGAYIAVEGSPPTRATIGCPAGSWGPTYDIVCSSQGTWNTSQATPICTACPPHNYPLGDLDWSMLEMEEHPGEIRIRCADHFIHASRAYACDKKNGTWTPWDSPPHCEAIPASPTPTPTTTAEPTPSSSKTPRPVKVKGSRAPSAPPKIRGSRAPVSRPLGGV